MPRNATEIGSRRHYTFNGVEYPSVTTIIKMGTPKEWLGAWAAKVVAESAINSREYWMHVEIEHGTEGAIKELKRMPWAKRDAAADHGTGVHETLERIVKGEDYEEGPQSAALLDWLNGYSVHPILSEFQVVNTLDSYAGTGDLIAGIGGERWLVDLKTGPVLDYTTRLQLAAYRYAESVFLDDEIVCTVASLGIQHAGVLQVHTNSEDKCKTCHLPDGSHFFEVRADGGTYINFLHVKAVHDVVRANGKPLTGYEIVLPQVPVEAA